MSVSEIARLLDDAWPESDNLPRVRGRAVIVMALAQAMHEAGYRNPPVGDIAWEWGIQVEAFLDGGTALTTALPDEETARRRVEECASMPFHITLVRRSLGNDAEQWRVAT